MADIAVEAIGDDTYRVTVAEGESSTSHAVIATASDVDTLGGSSPETLVEASFRFLLDREPKESILRRFELPVIARYFPEYPSRIGEYL